MGGHYILEGKVPKPVSLMEWASWFEKFENRRVANTKSGDVCVSTVFLGLDHRFDESDGKEPLIFETMIFGAPDHEDYQVRCSTWEQAIEQHNIACALAGLNAESSS